MLRDIPIGWNWEVYTEMFVAGIAAGAYLTAAILEFIGRGRSPIARTAHLSALPLALVATLLLIYKLEQSQRFWHMVIQSENIPNLMFKWWSPISFGSWFLIVFSLFVTVSFIDAIIDRGWLRLGPWGAPYTLHGSIVGVIWMIGGALSALSLAAYSGMLLSVTAVRGWVDTVFISPFFLAISFATGLSFLLLIEALRKAAPLEEVASLSRAQVLAVAWQLIVLVIVAISLGSAITYFASTLRMTIALILAVVLALAGLGLAFFRSLFTDAPRIGIAAALILVSGFLFRYVTVMGPQYAISE